MRKKLLHLPLFAAGLGVFLTAALVGDARADKMDESQAKYIHEHPEFHGFLTPHPLYPLQARMAQAQGIVQVRVSFAAAGKVKNVEVVKSSGSPILDSNTTGYIKRYWLNRTGKAATHTLSVAYGLQR